MESVLVLAHGLMYGGAQISTLETIKGLIDRVDQIHVAVCSDADPRFVTNIKQLGLTVLPVSYRKVAHNPDLQMSGISDIIRHVDFVWIADEAYLSAPRIKRIRNIPVVCHLRCYALICRTWGASCGLAETCWERCSPRHLTRCKRRHNEDLFRLGILSRERSALYSFIDYAKGPWDYYRWPLRNNNVIDCIDGFISVSRATLEIHKRHRPILETKPCEVIYESLALSRIADELASARGQHNGWEENHRATVMYMDAQGGIPIKGPHIYLQAIKILLKKGVNINAILLGCKDTWVEEYARNLSLTDKVTFLRRIDSMVEVYKLIAESSVVVVPSLWPEPLGRVAVEAQSLGVPVVASEIGGLPETIIDGETGYLAKPGSPEDLADKIESALAARFSSQRIRNLTHKKFDRSRQLQQFMNFARAI